MKTHTEIKVWACEDAEITVGTSKSIAWAEITGGITIHPLGRRSPIDDLDVLEAFFQKGLTAVQEARQGKLFADLVHG